MYNKTMFFDYTMIGKKCEVKSIYSIYSKKIYLHIVSKIQDDLLVSIYFIKLKQSSNIRIVC